MPVYEYRCQSCGEDVEMLQALGSAPPTCDACGGALRKRFSRVAVRYDAWGFNRTDALVARPGTKDFKALRERAEQVSDER